VFMPTYNSCPLRSNMGRRIAYKWSLVSLYFASVPKVTFGFWILRKGKEDLPVAKLPVGREKTLSRAGLTNNWLTHNANFSSP
jgi:hypothetical protein